MNKQEYRKLLQDPRWKAKRLEILERDGYKCTNCGVTKYLHVHHLVYEDEVPWESKNEELITLCRSCHKLWHSENNTPIRQYFKNIGWKKNIDFQDGNNIKITTLSKIISDNKIINCINENKSDDEYKFIEDTLSSLEEDIINIFFIKKFGKIKIDFNITGDINANVSINISYNDPKLSKVVKKKSKFLKSIQWDHKSKHKLNKI